MRQRFRARELWLLVPFLIIGLAALLYWRWEQVTPADKRGFYVSKTELQIANGHDREFGISHYVTVTLSHSWPRPLWWGTLPVSPDTLDPLAPNKKPKNIYAVKAPADVATGGVLYQMQAGKKLARGEVFSNFGGYITFDGQNYKVQHQFNLREVPDSAGEITFEGLYQMKGSPKVVAQRVVRAKGERLPPAPKPDPGIRVVSVTATPWEQYPLVYPNGKTEQNAETVVEVIVKHTKPLPEGKNKHSVGAYGQELTTALAPNKVPNGALDFGTGGAIDFQIPKTPLPSNQSRVVFTIILTKPHLFINPTMLHGKISADDRWPLPFEMQLPSPPMKKRAGT